MSEKRFSRYELRQEMGLGGMSTVYLAYDPSFDREVALKILKRELVNQPQVRERFERETRLIARLEHPAIVPVYDVGYDQEQLFLVMRHMGGGDLTERVRKGPLPLNEIAGILERIAGALDYAHSKGIIHRDLKPGNILFDQDNNAYISDFGIARLAQSASNITASGVIGTPTHMSPEQARGDSLDGRSDIYALGIMLFEMLTGRTPFEANSPIEMLYKHIHAPPPHVHDLNPEVPPAVDAVIEKVLAKERDDRYSSGAELAKDFKAALAGKTIVKPTDNTSTQNMPPLEAKSTRPFFPYLGLLRGLTWLVLVVLALWGLFRFALWFSSSPTTIETTRLVLGIASILVILGGLTAVLVYVYKSPPRILREDKPGPPPKTSVDQRPAPRETSMTTNLLAAIDPKKRKELLFLIGRNPEMRLKDRLVYFGGGRYILHGFGRFGATALIDQIVKIAEYEFEKLNQVQDKGIIMTIRIDATTLEEKDGEVSAVIREFKYGARHVNFARSFKTQVERLDRNRLAEVISSSDEKVISIKAAPLPGIEANFSRKSGKGGAGSKVSGEDLLRLVADFLDRAERQKPNSVDVLIDRVLRNTTLPSRIIFVIDRIKSESVFSILKRLRLFDDDRITFFAIVKQEQYLAWKRKEEIMNMVRELRFQFHYVPCLWEEKTAFVDNLLKDAFQYKVVGDQELLLDFKDHIAFVARGAPGDAVLETLKTDYCEYPFGEPKLNLDKIRNIGEVKTNAHLQRILARNWDTIFASRFKKAREEDEDRARWAIYHLVDWIHSQIVFDLPSAQQFALHSDLRISDADPIVLNILQAFLTVLVAENYLSFSDGNYGVAHLTVPEDIQRKDTGTRPKKKSNSPSKRVNSAGKSNRNSSRKPL